MCVEIEATAKLSTHSFVNGNNFGFPGSKWSVRSLVVAALVFIWLTGCESAEPPTRPASSHTIHKPVSFGDTLVEFKLIHYVRAQYPDWARREHIEGTVELRATVGKDGRVRDLVFVKGPKVLAPYAEAAVRKWRYKPVIFHGTPVEVKTVIMVPFLLSR